MRQFAMRVRGVHSELFSIDARALAALRIVLAILLLADLAVRAPDLMIFYVDPGVYPMALAREMLPFPLSVHMLDGSPWFQAALLGLAALAAAMLLVGYRTRLATVVSWYLLVSLHRRNFWIEDVGDCVLRLLLFWCIFLPLGRCYAVDARRSTTGVQERRVLSVAGAGLLLQPAFVYVVGALIKLQGPAWHDGTAVRQALSNDVWVQPLGTLMLDVPRLPELFTYGTLVAEGLLPFLLFIPVRTNLFRSLAIVGLVGFQIGIGSTIWLAWIPWIMSAALIPFLPAAVWDRLDRLLPRAPPAAPRVPTVNGARRTTARVTRIVQLALPSLALLWVVAANVDSLTEANLPRAVLKSGGALGLTQAWAMYRNPLAGNFRLILGAELETGHKVYRLVEAERPGWPTGPAWPRLEAMWNTYRGRMFFEGIGRPQMHRELAAFVAWVCQEWENDYGERLRSVHIVRVARSPRRPGDPADEPRPVVRNATLRHDECRH